LVLANRGAALDPRVFGRAHLARGADHLVAKRIARWGAAGEEGQSCGQWLPVEAGRARDLVLARHDDCVDRFVGKLCKHRPGTLVGSRHPGVSEGSLRVMISRSSIASVVGWESSVADGLVVSSSA
jgi:hypothetical protein